MKIDKIKLVGHHIKMIKTHQRYGMIPSYLICKTISLAYEKDFAYNLYKTMRWIKDDTLITPPTTLGIDNDCDDICNLPCPYVKHCSKDDKNAVLKEFRKKIGPLYDLLEGKNKDDNKLKKPKHWSDFLCYVEFDVIPGNTYRWGDLKEMPKGESLIVKAREISKDKNHPLIKYYSKVSPEYNDLDSFIVKSILNA